MARPFHLPPRAASLSASLRDLGYSLEAAIADVIDNSISADATEIQIFCDLSQSIPVLVISDNGRGMNEAALIDAMRHGAVAPREIRASKDLGRFGLGLKTASFSQCRQLTVISSKANLVSGVEWNLDDVEVADDWFVSILDSDDIAHQPYIDTLGSNGTLVIWRDLDRLLEEQAGRKRDEIVSEKLVAVERHLSLVFHRFLAGEVRGRKKLTIKINGHPIVAFDPFCKKNAATQALPDETIWFGDDAVRIQPYILPHHSRLAASEYDYYQDRSDFISNQGAYVYRNARLMAWGDWFRLIPKGETTKLARVQIDFPNSLDEAWTIDIKKSRARPPHAVRERLRQIIAKITARSVTVHRGRGQKLFQESEAPMWERYADHQGINFVINLAHPLIEALRGKLETDQASTLNVVLKAVGSALPVEMIYSDYSTSPRDVKQSTARLPDACETLKSLKEVLFGDQAVQPEQFLAVIRSTRLFEGQDDVIAKFLEEAFNGK